MNELSTEDFVAISKLSPEERFEYALEKIIEQKQLWGLYGENGWLLLKAEDDACLPVWPHESFAQAWEKDEFPDCKPQAIALQDWLQQWLPGMNNNGTLVLMFPLSEDEEGIMLESTELMDCFEQAISAQDKSQ